MFSAPDKAKAEEAMTLQGFTWEWHDNGDCTVTSARLDAIKECSNGNKAFFNQIVAAYTGWVDARNEYGQCVTYATPDKDGNSALPKEVVEKVAQFMEDNKMVYRW